MIESLGPHLFKDPILRQKREHEERARSALFILWNSDSPETKIVDFMEHFNALQQAKAFPPHVKQLITQLEIAGAWGHEKKVRAIAKQLLPYFS